MGQFLRAFLKQSLLPPTIILWMFVLGLIFKTTLGWLPWLALFSLYFLSTAPVSNLLIRGLEQYPPVEIEACKTADALVVLGGGYPRVSPELPGYQPTPLGLERIRYGALLSRQCPLPILVAGGGHRPESETMARVMKDDYGVEVTWIENKSMTTWENALYTRAMLGRERKKVVLVTHAWHMPRAVLSFERAGFTVIPAPTAFTWKEVPWKKPAYWLPRVRNLRVSEIALHEYLGKVWYWATSRE